MAIINSPLRQLNLALKMGTAIANDRLVKLFDILETFTHSIRQNHTGLFV